MNSLAILIDARMSINVLNNDISLCGMDSEHKKNFSVFLLNDFDGLELPNSSLTRILTNRIIDTGGSETMDGCGLLVFALSSHIEQNYIGYSDPYSNLDHTKSKNALFAASLKNIQVHNNHFKVAGSASPIVVGGIKTSFNNNYIEHFNDPNYKPAHVVSEADQIGTVCLLSLYTVIMGNQVMGQSPMYNSFNIPFEDVMSGYQLNMGTNWEAFRFYQTSSSNTFFFQSKRISDDRSEIYIHKVAGDEVMAEIVQSGIYIEAGCTSFEFFQTSAGTFLFTYKAPTAKVYKIRSDGRLIDSPIQEIDIGNDWESTKFYKTATGKVILLLIKTTDPSSDYRDDATCEIESNGKLKVSDDGKPEIDTLGFSIGNEFKSVEFYHVNQDTFLFLFRDERGKIYKLNNDGSFPSEILQNPHLGNEWHAAKFYTFCNQLFLVAVKEDGGIIYQVSADGTIQDTSVPYKHFEFKNENIVNSLDQYEIFELDSIPFPLVFIYDKDHYGGAFLIQMIKFNSIIYSGNITNSLPVGTDDFPSPESGHNLILPTI